MKRKTEKTRRNTENISDMNKNKYLVQIIKSKKQFLDMVTVKYKT